MDYREFKVRSRLKSDLTYFASKNLKILNKHGNLKPFVFNTAQKFIDSKLNRQLKTTGKVRAIILKGRQQGCSTYISARFYHKLTHARGKSAYIIAHDSETTRNLFNISLRFYEYSSEFIKPSCSQKAQNRLVFDNLDSSYTIGTAGSKQSGRGQTRQFIHGSEVAFWDNGADIGAGLIQAVPDLENTEIILESTSRGIGDYFHTQWQLAEAQKSEFQAIFVPWYWQSEYQKFTNVKEFIATDEEKELLRLYDLSINNLAWRRKKIYELESDGTDGQWAFMREYPNSALEAFSVKDTQSFIKYEHVLRAANNEVEPCINSPLILGVDPARYGDDKTAFIFRQGNKAFGIQRFSNLNTIEVTRKILEIAEENEHIAQICIDEGGLGSGIVDNVNNSKFGYKCLGVNFGSSAEENIYFNKRVAMWGKMRHWLTQENVDIPNDNALHQELVNVNYEHFSDYAMKLESKKAIKKRTLKSPDVGDALALTFSGNNYDLSMFQNLVPTSFW